MASTPTQRWAPLSGNISYDKNKNELTFEPTKGFIGTDKETGKHLPPIANVRSNIEFEQGQISCEVIIEEPDARVQIALPGRDGKDVYAGLNVLGVAYGFALLGQAGDWEAGGGTGFKTVLPVNQPIELKLAVKGSSIELFVDGVSVATSDRAVKRGPIGVFFQSTKKIVVRNLYTESIQPECFVVMQFSAPYDDLYSDVIRPVCLKFGFEVNRVDDIYTPGSIMDDIIRSIQKSAVVIADISPDNPNVFYEIGFAHGINKPTILLCNKTERAKLPFDVSGQRTILYDNTIGGKKNVEEALERHLRSLTISVTTSQSVGPQG